MYDHPHPRRLGFPAVLRRLLDWTRYDRLAALAVAFAAAFLAVTCAGCVAPLAPTASALGDSAGPGGLPAAVAAARAAGGPLAASTASALRAASGLNLLGGFALVAGFVYGCIPRLPTGVGVGLSLGGAACLLAGVLLPLVSGWVGLALLVLATVAAGAHHGLLARLKNLLPTLPVKT